MVICGIGGLFDGVFLLLAFPSFTLMLNNSTPLIQITLSSHRVVTLGIVVKALNLFLLLFERSLGSISSQLKGIHNNVITHAFFYLFYS